jgi:hypothetical protein
MIIYTNAFLLSEAATQQPLSNARIGYQTWTRDLDPSAVTASSETEDGPADAPLRPDTYEYWEPETLPATWVVDLGQLRAVDYVGIVGRFNGCSVEVETSPDGDASTYQPLASDVNPGTDAPLMFLDDSRQARYVRISLAGSAAPQIAVVYAGEVLEMQRSLYAGHTPIVLSRNTELHHSMSRGGQFLGQGIRSMGVEGAASFKYLTAEWYREYFDPFVLSARQRPYFFAWRPEDFPNEVAYVWTDKDIAPRNMGTRDFMEVSWKMQGIGYDE